MTLELQTDRAWQPVKPESWSVAQVAHLHLRAGFGADWKTIEEDQQRGMEKTIADVLQGRDQCPDGRSAEAYADSLEAMKETLDRGPTMDALARFTWFRLTHSPHPLAEKMWLVWHHLFATSQQKVRNVAWMLDQSEQLRANWDANASKLHLAMLRCPAMLTWLDGADNTVESPNENLAREYFELFALGEGNYTERDIQEAARVLTGWKLQRVKQETQPVFDEKSHDPGEKTLFGASGKWTDKDLVRITCQRKAAAMYLARTLYRWFIDDIKEPEDKLLVPLAEAMQKNGDLSVRKGLEVLFRSRIFYAASSPRRRIKTPVEFITVAIRGCRIYNPRPNLDQLSSFATAMGQQLFFPPTVAGWAGGLEWLNSSALLGRNRFATAIERIWQPATRRRLSEADLHHLSWSLIGSRLVSDDAARILRSANGAEVPIRRAASLIIQSAAANLC